jgi:hypothetical protein
VQEQPGVYVVSQCDDSYSLRLGDAFLAKQNSPLLVMLHVLSGDEDDALEGGGTDALLHDLADMADPSDYSTQENQLILAKQLIEHGANVNAVSSGGTTPLHNACYSGVVTNLDFVELLLEAGADPNAQDHMGKTPLMATTTHAPGAAKILLNWPTTDVNITTRSGESFLVRLHSFITTYSDLLASFAPTNGRRAPVEQQFLLKQWRGIEEMLVERGAH